LSRWNHISPLPSVQFDKSLPTSLQMPRNHRALSHTAFRNSVRRVACHQKPDRLETRLRRQTRTALFCMLILLLVYELTREQPVM
jgi:hypothetical protein